MIELLCLIGLFILVVIFPNSNYCSRRGANLILVVFCWGWSFYIGSEMIVGESVGNYPRLLMWINFVIGFIYWTRFCFKDYKREEAYLKSLKKEGER